MEWTRNEYNQFMESEGVLLSYNPDVNANPMSRSLNVLGGALGLETKSEETALKIDGNWYILNGDFRKEYEAVFPDKEKLLAVYQFNKEYRSDWSTDE